jgi:hypothetical protein
VTYPASQTGQIREAASRDVATTLVIHELRFDGSIRCGRAVDPWNGHEMVLVELGPGQVTCGSCARTNNEDAPSSTSRYAPGPEGSIGSVCPTCHMELPVTGVCGQCS